MEALLEQIRRGDRRSLARGMSLVDRGGPSAGELTDRLRATTGNVPWWGLTGPPGVGKSTLVDALLGLLRQQQRRVGVVAVDPTSPSSDGALLGDRVRMMRHAVDPEVFIRSLATHHCAGGLSDATVHCARLLELAGFDPVLIETVGVGQSEADIAAVANVCVVVLGPGYGDDIQLTKAGLLEIADIVVVNKCDLPEAQRLLTELHHELTPTAAAGLPAEGDPASTPNGVEIVGIEAKSGRGVPELLDKLLRADSAARDPARRARHNRRRVLAEVRRRAVREYEEALDRDLRTLAAAELIASLERGEVSLEEVIGRHFAGSGSSPAE